MDWMHADKSNKTAQTFRGRFAWLGPAGQVRLEERDYTVGPGEALVRVKVCGICGSDIARYRRNATTWYQAGHEYSGRVVAVGEQVDKLDIGQLVSGVGSLPCYGCRNCVRGLPHLCLTPFGNKGAFAEYICRRADLFFPFDGLSAEQGALLEPLTVALQLVEDVGPVSGCHVAVWGAGPIGLMTLMATLEAGAKECCVVHPKWSRARWNAALEIGATKVWDAEDPNLESRLRFYLPDGFDAVMITSPPSTALATAIKTTGKGGRIAFVGMEWHPEVTVSFPFDIFHDRKLTLIGSNHDPCHGLYAPGVRFLKKYPALVNHIISHRYSLDEVDLAFQHQALKEAEVIKVVILP